MKNSYGIYYLIIVFLIIMMLVPPLFRMLIPKENSSAVVAYTANRLTCNQTKTIADKNIVFSASTIYLDSKLASLKLSYTKLENKNSTESFITTFEALKQIENVKYDSAENSIFFDFRKFDYSKTTTLDIYSKDIASQKQYYEVQGFTCEIIKN